MARPAATNLDAIGILIASTAKQRACRIPQHDGAIDTCNAHALPCAHCGKSGKEPQGNGDVHAWHKLQMMLIAKSGGRVGQGRPHGDADQFMQRFRPPPNKVAKYPCPHVAYRSHGLLEVVNDTRPSRRCRVPSDMWQSGWDRRGLACASHLSFRRHLHSMMNNRISTKLQKPPPTSVSTPVFNVGRTLYLRTR